MRRRRILAREEFVDIPLLVKPRNGNVDALPIVVGDILVESLAEFGGK